MSEAMWIVIGIVSTLAIMKRKLKLRGKTLIKIQGHLNGKWKECFEGMEISYEGNNTILTGNIKDEASFTWNSEYHKGLQSDTYFGQSGGKISYRKSSFNNQMYHDRI